VECGRLAGTAAAQALTIAIYAKEIKSSLVTKSLYIGNRAEICPRQDSPSTNERQRSGVFST
ncbi:MAG: hypothetical protein KJ884_05695, partial [Gammaproteobacteria bacterium]|nr:hypothetical protein [Gammaproteobacteria bacterium]